MEQKIILIYLSKTGFTKKYAQWLKEALNCDMIPFQKKESVDFSQYDTVIYGSSFHAGSIRGIKWLKGIRPSLTKQKVIVFVTGSTPTNTPEIEKTMDGNFTEEEKREYQTFYLRGGLCYEKMGFIDKLMMSFLRKIVKKQKGEKSEMYQVIAHSFDDTSKERIVPIVDCVRE